MQTLFIDLNNLINFFNNYKHNQLTKFYSFIYFNILIKFFLKKI